MYQIFLKHPKFTVLVFLCFINFGALGQTPKIDSLRQELATEGESYEVIFGLGYELFDVDNREAVQFSKRAYELGIELGDSLKIATSGRIHGQLLRRNDRLNESINVLSEILPIARRNKFTNEEKSILNALAIGYTFIADYDKALDVHFQALVIREREGNNKEISHTLNNIGVVYFKLRNYPQALEYYNKSLKLREETKDVYDLDRLIINIGLCYNQLANYVEAEKFINRGLSLCKNNCKDEIRVEGEFGLGVSYYNRGNLDVALDHFQTSFTIAKQTNYKRFQAENLVYKGKIFIKKNEIDSAVAALEESEEFSISSGYNELLIDTYRQLSTLYNKTQDFENAAEYQSKYINLKDSTYSEDLIDNIAKIQTKYAERENLATIAAKEEVIQRQRSLNIAIVIIAVLAALLIFVLYRSIQVKKKVNQALSDAKAIIEDQNRQLLNSNFSLDRELKERNVDLQKANESLQRVNEELDNFIYKTSHDIRGPLASLKGMCNVALMDVKDVLALNYLKKLDITAEKLNTILTRLLIVNQINNSALGSEKIDFGSIVADVLILEKKKGLPPRLKVSKMIDDDIVYYSDREFVRIILENLIDNAIKFYNDSERVEPFVDIAVTEEDNHVKIKVVDNGIGISQVHPDKIFQMFSRASERSETGGIGLYITKTATEKLGGEVNLKTTPEGYTEFFVLLPLSMARVAMA